MAGGIIKDFALAVLLATLGMIGGDIVQYFAGPTEWFPDGRSSFTFWYAAYIFSRHPLWKSR